MVFQEHLCVSFGTLQSRRDCSVDKKQSGSFSSESGLECVMLGILSVTWHKLECPSVRLQVIIVEWDALSMFEKRGMLL